MLEALIERLAMFGYEVRDTDRAALNWAVEKAVAYICNECNVREVPEGLFHVAVDMAAGEFLRMKKTFAPDDLTGLDLSAAVKQLKEGDADVSFAVGEGTQTQEQRLDSLIQALLTCGTSQFSCFRRLRW